MPPTGQPTFDFSNIDHAVLSQMLKEYGVDVGPINAATRKTYERRLVQLKTGSLPPSSQPPVDDDDDDDEEVQIRQPEAHIRQPEALRRPVQNLSDSTHSYVSSVMDSGFSASKSYEYSRHTGLSADVRSRPSLPADRQTPSLYSTPLRRPVPTKMPQEKGNSIPLWLKLVAVAIAVTLIYLIYINMEPAPVSNIPEIQNKVEV